MKAWIRRPTRTVASVAPARRGGDLLALPSTRLLSHSGRTSLCHLSRLGSAAPGGAEAPGTGGPEAGSYHMRTSSLHCMDLAENQEHRDSVQHPKTMSPHTSVTTRPGLPCQQGVRQYGPTCLRGAARPGPGGARWDGGTPSAQASPRNGRCCWGQPARQGDRPGAGPIPDPRQTLLASPPGALAGRCVRTALFLEAESGQL